MSERKWIATGNLAWRERTLENIEHREYDWPVFENRWELMQEMIELEIGDFEALTISSTWRPIPILPPDPPMPTLTGIPGVPFDLYPPQSKPAASADHEPDHSCDMW